MSYSVMMFSLRFCSHGFIALVVVMNLLGAPRPAFSQNDGIPPIGTIEIFGNRDVTTAEVRAALGFKEGDYALPQLDYTLGGLLARKMNVERVTLDGTCCDDQGNVLVFVGVDEDGTANLTFRPAPNGSAVLPQVVYDTFLAFNSEVRVASLSSNPTEDLSEGHALISDPNARREQEKFLVFASEQREVLKRVLAESSDANHRAVAAYIIGYAENKQDVVADLVDAALDPSDSVRTNATRALSAIARLGASRPERGIEIPPDVFIDMINSVTYADRAMGIRVLAQLSRGRDPEVLDALRARALPSLVEMARWRYSGHNDAPYQILGRVVGLSEDEISASEGSGRETVIQRALALD